MKILALVLLSAFSLTAMAHTGHGETSAFAHDLEHALWYAGAFAIIALIAFALRKRQ